ncbi:MAG: hypothetical protein E7235_01540, partial [Lachnospiraceae bacterium]|nr:hypothetical protein [Lachnospiraceae bacterium]
MKLKKLIALVAAMTMSLAMASVVAFAEEATNTTPIVVKTAGELQKAIDDAIRVPGNVTIQLGADISGDVKITQTKDLYLTIDGTAEEYNFNGILTISGRSATMVEGQSTTLKNIDFVGKENATACILVQEKDTDISDNGDYGRYVCNLSVINCDFSGGTATTTAAIKTETGGDYNWLIQNCNVTGMHSLMQVKNINGLTIEKCTVKESGRGVSVNESNNVLIKGCTFNVQKYAIRFGQGASADPVQKNIELINNTITTTIGPDGSYDDAAITMRGNTYGIALEMSGNTITADAKMQTYGVREADMAGNIWKVPNAVAKIGDNTYASLADAIKNAEDNDTIVLLKESSGEGIFVEPDQVENLTIDLNTFTYTVEGPAVGSKDTESQAWHIEKGNSITIKNGTLDVVEDKTGEINLKVLIMNYCDLTLDSVVVDGRNLIADKWVMSFNNGNSVITGNTQIIAADTKSDDSGNIAAFDVDGTTAPSTYKNVSLTFDEKFVGEVYGPFYYYASTTDKVATLIIKAGSFTQKPNEFLVAGKTAVEQGDYFVVEDIKDSTINSAITETTTVVTEEASIGNDVNLSVEEEIKLAENAEIASSVQGSAEGYATAMKSAANAVKDTVVDNDEVLEKLTEAVGGNVVNDIINNVEGNTNTITVEVKPYLDVTIKEVEIPENSSEITSVTVEIKPVCDVVASVKDSTGTVVGEEVTVSEKQPIKVTKTVDVIIPLPNGFADDGDTIYVTHAKTNNGVVTDTYRYEGKVTVADGKTYATFTNPNGFSTFVVTTSAPIGAVNGTPCATLAEAIAAADDEDIIELLDDVTFSGEIVISDDIIINGNGNTITINGGSLFITGDVSLNNIVFEGSSHLGNRFGIVEFLNSTSTVNDCTFNNNNVGSVIAIDTSGDKNTGTSKVAITNCKFSNNDCDVAAVYCYDGEGSAIENCDFTENKSDISVIYISDDAIVTGCYFEDNEVSNSSILVGPYDGSTDGDTSYTIKINNNA